MKSEDEVTDITAADPSLPTDMLPLIAGWQTLLARVREAIDRRRAFASPTSPSRRPCRDRHATFSASARTITSTPRSSPIAGSMPLQRRWCPKPRWCSSKPPSAVIGPGGAHPVPPRSDLLGGLRRRTCGGHWQRGARHPARRCPVACLWLHDRQRCDCEDAAAEAPAVDLRQGNRRLLSDGAAILTADEAPDPTALRLRPGSTTNCGRMHRSLISSSIFRRSSRRSRQALRWSPAT